MSDFSNYFKDCIHQNHVNVSLLSRQSGINRTLLQKNHNRRKDSIRGKLLEKGAALYDAFSSSTRRTNALISH